jgi:hypothetical protein
MSAATLSVVIGTHNAAGVITVSLEVIVADCSTDATPDIISRHFPSIRLLHFDEPLPLAALRGRGIAVARGTVIAILDPFSVAAGDWASQVIAAHTRTPHGVIGGSVDLYQAEAASYASWTTYLNEYGLFMSPCVPGATWILPGSNVSYKRAVLFDQDQPRYPVFWKTFVNWAQETAGSPMWLEPAIRVELNKPIAFADFLTTRYHHGRCFGGMRTAGASGVTRLGRAASTILVPALQAWRWTTGFWPKRRHRGRFVATLPAQLLLFSLWSLGEAVGYLRGTGGACERTYY